MITRVDNRGHFPIGAGLLRLRLDRLSRLCRLGRHRNDRLNTLRRLRFRLGWLGRSLRRRRSHRLLRRRSRFVSLSLRLIHAHVVNVHGRTSAVSALVIISVLGRINIGLIRPVTLLRQVASAHHLVKHQHQVIVLVKERIVTLDITHLHGVRQRAVEVKLDSISRLAHTIGMELTLRRGRVTMHHTLVLGGLRRLTDPRRVHIAHQVGRIIALGLEHVDLTVSGVCALGASAPKRRPRRTRTRQLDTRLGVKTCARRGIQHLAVLGLRRDHARRERCIIGHAAVLARTWNLSAVPLGLRGRVTRSQIQIPISHRNVIRAVSVLSLRPLSRIEAAVLIAPLGGIELGTVELIVERHLIVTCDSSGQRGSASRACRAGRRGSCRCCSRSW